MTKAVKWTLALSVTALIFSGVAIAYTVISATQEAQTRDQKIQQSRFLSVKDACVKRNELSTAIAKIGIRVKATDVDVPFIPNCVLYAHKQVALP